MVGASTQGILVCTRYKKKMLRFCCKGIFAVSLVDKKQSDKLYGLQNTIKLFNGSKDGQEVIWQEKYFGSDVIPRLEATKLFQRVWRGQRDRRLKVAPERLKLKNAWNWLNPILPQEAFEQFMPRSTYDVPGGHRPATISNALLGGSKVTDTAKLVKYLSMCKDGIDGVDVHKPKSNKNTTTRCLQKIN